MPIEFLPRGADEKTIGQYKVQFADWIVACGLREMLEHYGLMLDHVHKCALLVAHAKGFIATVGDPVKLQRDFSWRLGVADKLRQLESRFCIKPDRPTDICALYRARNALSHGFGVVREKDTDTSGALNLHWRAMEFWAVGEVTGAESPLGNLFEKATTEPTKIEARFVERERRFQVGQRLKLTEQDLWEICYYFSSSCIPSALGSFRDFLQSHEIPIAGIGERG